MLNAFPLLSAMPENMRLGDFTGHDDIGSPKIPGSATYDPATQSYTIAGAGTNMWFARDQFHFAWKRVRGDFILRTRFEFIGSGSVAHRKVGWMVRPNLDADAPYADCAEHGDGLTSLQFRRSKGAPTEQLVLSITNADVLQFERKSNTFTFSAARFGEPFVSTNLAGVDLGDDVYVGLFVCSHSGDVLEKAVFHDVRMIRPARDNFVPYRDYIGSILEIVDISTGRAELISQSSQPFEAPNWTRDGQALIYNVSGRAAGWGNLCRLDLSSKQQSIINTSPANRNNNDHVLSFDGAMMAISDQTSGQSAVSTVPLSGGTPKRLTPLTPSYAHGWSPDGQYIVYTGGRSNKFDIYRVPAGGGAEVRLTDSTGLNDGPEYSPDGKFIYFNSSRTGLMQLWRMNPDGTGLEQVTNDDYNNWFPHISPDGRWIAFVSFQKDLLASEHPYYKRVYIRLMPTAGGKPKVIAYVYGGQGTMNVPSWSPDSRKFAFVSNSDF